MIDSVERIVKKIKEGQITALSLDTTIFDQHHLKLEFGLLARLKQFKESENSICLADVVCREVERHLAQKAELARKALQDAAKAVEQTWQQPKARTVIREVFPDETTAQEHAARRFRKYLEVIGAEIISHEPATLGEVLERYFAELPPFSNQKKAEFPDSIALIALESWAKKSKTNMLVVTKDKDWLEFCTGSNHLVAMTDLSVALSCFQSETARFASELIEKQIRDGDPHEFGERIRAAIKENFENVLFDPDAETDLDFEIESMRLVDIPSLEFAEETQDDAFEPVEMHDEELVLRIRVYPLVRMVVELSFFVWGGSERERFLVGSLELNHEQVLELHTFVTFTVGQIHHALPTNLSIASVELPEQLHFLELGEIAPDTIKNTLVPAG